MTDQTWQVMASYICLCNPPNDQVRNAAKTLFDGYTQEDINKAMSIFHSYCIAVEMDPAMETGHKLSMYACAGIAFDAAAQTVN